MARNRTTTSSNLGETRDVTPRTPQGCEECLLMGDTWVHLRLCMICGHFGCCDNSKYTHATRYFHAANHPIMTSFEPGEDWGWRYLDELFLDAISLPVRVSRRTQFSWNAAPTQQPPRPLAQEAG